jgi:hypothetical protein
MKKLRLELDALAVESFAPAREPKTRRGTVRGRAAQPATYDFEECGSNSEYSVVEGCTDQEGCTNFYRCTGISVCYWTP